MRRRTKAIRHARRKKDIKRRHLGYTPLLQQTGATMIPSPAP